MAWKKNTKGKITSWSLSRWGVYSECPARARGKYIDKLPEPDFDENNPAMVRGRQLHEAAEFYVRGHLKKLPPDLKKMAKNLDKLRGGYKTGKVKTELDAAFTIDWKPTSWFGRDAWLRVKIDALSLLVKKTLSIIDYKTGRLKNEHSIYDEQLELYAVAGLIINPTVDVTRGELWFTDHNKIVTSEVGTRTRDELPKLIEKWEDTVAPMLNDTRFAPRPGSYCRYCPFSMNKGGPCPY